MAAKKQTKQTKPTKPTDLWAAFVERHHGNPFLKLDPLYALPEALIDIIAGNPSKESAIERQGVAPNFLTKQEDAFERDLARTVSGGFFQQRPFECLLLGKCDDPKLARLSHQIEAELVENLKDEGVNPKLTQKALDAHGDYQTLANERAVGYAGWLLTNSQFRRERDELRSTWGNYVDTEHRFPAMPASFLGEAIGPVETRGKEYAHFIAFYRRWGLQTFLTWDLPVPLRPSVYGITLHDMAGSSEAGVNLFVPWYVLRDGRFQLQELAHHLQTLQNPAHLAGWLETTTAGKGEHGDARFRTVMVLYRYQWLAIESRYAGRPSWDKKRQDEAFAQFLNLGEESIRRLRFFLQKQLAH